MPPMLPENSGEKKYIDLDEVCGKAILACGG